MQVEIEIWEKVWQRTTATVIVDEAKLADYAAGSAGIEDYLMERADDWMDTAYTAYEFPVEQDTDIYITVLEG